MKPTRQRHAAARRPAARARSSSIAGAPAGLPRFLNPDAESDGRASKASFRSPLLAQKSSAWASTEDLPPCCDELDDARAFASGSYGPLDRIGPAGTGGFTAWYFPFGGDGVLHIVESGAAAFKDLLVISGGSIQPHGDLPTTPQLTALAARIQALPEPARTNALANYQWTAPERATWLGELEAVVERVWGFQHSFLLNRRCWDWIGAMVNVDVRLHTGPRTAADHLELETYKTPVGQSLRTFDVSHRVSYGSGTDARDQRMRLASTSTGERENDLLRAAVEFDRDSDVLTAAARASLRAFIARYDGATAHPAWSRARIDLIGRASSAGSEAHNQDLSSRRAEAVRAFLESNGLHDAPIRVHPAARGELDANQAVDDARDRRVDLLVDGGQRMLTGAHEFGHAFGLGDEYAAATSPIGSNATHHDLVRNMTDQSGRNLPGAAVEHSGSIMSFGSEVRPQHYATFHDALEQLTHQKPWSLGNRTDLRDTEAVCSGGGMPPCTGDTCVAANSGMPDVVPETPTTNLPSDLV